MQSISPLLSTACTTIAVKNAEQFCQHNNLIKTEVGKLPYTRWNMNFLLPTGILRITKRVPYKIWAALRMRPTEDFIRLKTPVGPRHFLFTLLTILFHYPNTFVYM